MLKSLFASFLILFLAVKVHCIEGGKFKFDIEEVPQIKELKKNISMVNIKNILDTEEREKISNALAQSCKNDADNLGKIIGFINREMNSRIKGKVSENFVAIHKYELTVKEANFYMYSPNSFETSTTLDKVKNSSALDHILGLLGEEQKEHTENDLKDRCSVLRNYFTSCMTHSIIAHILNDVTYAENIINYLNNIETGKKKLSELFLNKKFYWFKDFEQSKKKLMMNIIPSLELQPYTDLVKNGKTLLISPFVTTSPRKKNKEKMAPFTHAYYDLIRHEMVSGDSSEIKNVRVIKKYFFLTKTVLDNLNIIERIPENITQNVKKKKKRKSRKRRGRMNNKNSANVSSEKEKILDNKPIAQSANIIENSKNDETTDGLISSSKKRRLRRKKKNNQKRLDEASKAAAVIKEENDSTSRDLADNKARNALQISNKDTKPDLEMLMLQVNDLNNKTMVNNQKRAELTDEIKIINSDCEDIRRQRKQELAALANEYYIRIEAKNQEIGAVKAELARISTQSESRKNTLLAEKDKLQKMLALLGS